MAIDLNELKGNIKGDVLYTLSETSNLLNISRATVKYWVYRKNMPTVKVGRHVYIKGQVLLDMYGIGGKEDGKDYR